VSFPIQGTTAYNFTVVSAPSGTCGVAVRQSGTLLSCPTSDRKPNSSRGAGPVGDGTAFRQIKINYQQENECPPTSDSESSGTSFAVLIKPTSGCGGSDDVGLIAGLTAGTLPTSLFSTHGRLCRFKRRGADQAWWAERSSSCCW
jgi:hypothetical protein